MKSQNLLDVVVLDPIELNRRQHLRFLSPHRTLSQLHHSSPQLWVQQLVLTQLSPIMLQISPEVTWSLSYQLNLHHFWRMNQVNRLQTHTTKSYCHFKSCRQTFSSLKRQNQTSVSNSLLAFESFLVSNVDDIAGPDVAHQELFFSEGFGSLLFFNNGLDVLFGWHGSVHRRDDQREHDIGVIPSFLTWLSGFVIQSLTRDPILVEGSFVEGWTTRLVPDNNVVA